MEIGKKMKPLRFKVNFELPLRYENVVWQIYAHLKGNPSAIGKQKGGKIFIRDVYQFCVDCAMDVLEIDSFEKGDIEIVDLPGKDEDWLLDKLEKDPVFRKECYQIISKFSKKQLDDYEANYKPKGISSIEYWNLENI